MKPIFYPAFLILLAAQCIPDNGLDSSLFTIAIHPSSVREVIPAQRCVLLVEVSEDDDGSGNAVSLSAVASGATVTVEPSSIEPGQIAEVTVIPAEASANSDVTVTVTGTRGTIQDTAEKMLTVAEGDIQDYEDSYSTTAAEVRDRFIPWLEANHPELGITGQTEWTGMVVSPIWLVVSHYLYFSDEWEMHVYWHVMIAPYDWGKIDLRRRSSETAYSYSFVISSLSDNEGGPQVNELSDEDQEVWR